MLIKLTILYTNLLAKLSLGVNFINIFCARFFVQKCFAQLFSSYLLATKALSCKKHMRKMLAKLSKGYLFFMISHCGIFWQATKCSSYYYCTSITSKCNIWFIYFIYVYKMIEVETTSLYHLVIMNSTTDIIVYWYRVFQGHWMNLWKCNNMIVFR